MKLFRRLTRNSSKYMTTKQEVKQNVALIISIKMFVINVANLRQMPVFIGKVNESYPKSMILSPAYDKLELFTFCVLTVSNELNTSQPSTFRSHFIQMLFFTSIYLSILFYVQFNQDVNEDRFDWFINFNVTLPKQ